MKKFLIAAGVVTLAFAAVTSAATFNVNLTVGSTGADVVALQTALIAAGYDIPAISSGAVAKGYFGSQTQAAVKLYQAAKGIPNTGFVGPLTRAALNGGSTVVTTPVACPAGYVCTPTGGSSTPVSGGSEGQLKGSNLSGDVEDSLDEGDSAEQVLGLEMDAEDSDMVINRVDVDFENEDTDGSSLRINRYFTNVHLIFNGKKVATLPVSEADEDDDVYSFRFTGLNLVAEEDETSELFVAVDVVSAIDADDEGAEWKVTIPQDGIRAVDGAGISDTYPTEDKSEDGIAIGEAAVGDIELSLANSNPDADDVMADEDSDTTVTALVFELEANGQDVTVNDIDVLLTTTGASTSAMVRNLKLYNGSTLLGTESVSSAKSTTTVTFEDLDLDIDEDDTATLTVKATVKPLDTDSNNFNNGDSFNVSIDAADVDAEDVNGEDADVTNDVDGEEFTLRTEGLSITYVDVNESAVSGAPDGDDSGTYTIIFDAKAFGTDVYIGATSTEDNDGTHSAANGVSYSITNPGSNTSTSILVGAGSENNDRSDVWFIDSGETRRFTLTVSATASSTAFAYVTLEALSWGDTGTTIDELYESNLDNFKTEPLNLIAR